MGGGKRLFAAEPVLMYIVFICPWARESGVYKFCAPERGSEILRAGLKAG